MRCGLLSSCTALPASAVAHNPPSSTTSSPGLRTETSIAVETAQCFSTHHVAMLVGYGAHAVCPYLAFETCRQWRASPRTENLIKAGKVPDVTAETATINYKKALEKGILKILSKMGISLLSCYHGAQVGTGAAARWGCSCVWCTVTCARWEGGARGRGRAPACPPATTACRFASSLEGLTCTAVGSNCITTAHPAFLRDRSLFRRSLRCTAWARR